MTEIGHAVESTEKYHNLEMPLIYLFFTTDVLQGKKMIFWRHSSVFSPQVTKLGGLPNNVMDMWEFLGKPQHCRYTWDTSSNTNLGIASKCKLRFDRVYIRPAAEGGNIVPRSMDLIGLEKLDCGTFPSDHWGLLCNFDVIL